MQNLCHTDSCLKLRCKLPSGQHVIDKLTSQSTVADLLQAISSASGIRQANIIIYYGYPPKKLACIGGELCRHLSEIPLRSGDTITVDTTESIPDATIAQPNPAPQKPGSDTKPTLPRLVRLSAPSDNSCLFTSVLFCVNNANGRLPINSKVVTNLGAVSQLRELIGGIVLSDPQTFSEAFLGMPNEQYSRCIQEPDRWGGGIEVSVLSQLYEVEICVVDIQSCRIDRFGEDKQYAQRILLIYDGIHYDPLAQERPSEDRLVSVFPSRDNMILLEAQDLASRLREEREFTDMNSFTLICGQCNTPLTGQSGAQKHAMATGHTDYREIKL